jgi:GT2 family glycosyltransferase
VHLASGCRFPDRIKAAARKQGPIRCRGKIILDLSICILTHCQPELLPRCVAASVLEIERAGISAEIIVIDNASADGYPQTLATTYLGLTVIRNEENLNFSTANNRAIRQSQGRHVLLLNDDAIVQEHSLRLMVEQLDSQPSTGAVGPKLLNPDGSPQSGCTNKQFPNLRNTIFAELLPGHMLRRSRTAREKVLGWKDANQSTEDAESLIGACLMVRRAALEQVGLLDESFHFFLEDTDLCYRLREGGWRLHYLAEATVVHYGSASFRALSRPRAAVLWYRSTLLFFNKHWGTRKLFVLRSALILTFLLRGPLTFLYLAAPPDPNLAEAKRTILTYAAVLRLLLARDAQRLNRTQAV